MATLNGKSLNMREHLVLEELFHRAALSDHERGHTKGLAVIPAKSVPGTLSSLCRKGFIRIEVTYSQGDRIQTFFWKEVTPAQVEAYLEEAKNEPPAPALTESERIAAREEARKARREQLKRVAAEYREKMGLGKRRTS